MVLDVIGVVILLVLFNCYADNVVLLAPCPSALRTMLNICCSYAVSHNWNSMPQSPS